MFTIIFLKPFVVVVIDDDDDDIVVVVVHVVVVGFYLICLFSPYMHIKI